MCGTSCLGSRAPFVFKNDVPDSRIVGRYSIKPVDFIDLIIKRTAHDQPHDHFHAFRAGLAHVLDVWNARELLRIFRQSIEAILVPFAVEKAGALRIERDGESVSTED